MGFFKAYDMRGTFGVDFDLDTVYRVGLALPRVVPGRRWLVGRDGRETSGSVRDALVRGLCDAGALVTDLGLATTPMVYYFTGAEAFDGSVMITASHNPPTDNGLKVSRRGALPVGYADGLDRVEALVRAPGALKPAEAQGRVSYLDVRARYGAWQADRIDRTALDTLRFAVDCSNGMASLFAHDLFPKAEILNGTIDGRFPAHSPNPLLAEAREQLAACVREKGLDCGVIFDGDADRAMFVDERGEFIQPDYLIPVIARATLEIAPHEPLPRVLHDVRTSRGAIEALREMGCEPTMVPVGHAFAKPAMRRANAVCGGELAGHYYFSEFFNCDSGILAALRVLGEIARAKAMGRRFSQMMAPIAGRYANSGERNYRIEDKDAAIARVLACAARELPPETGRETMDGIRLEYAEGWVNIRKSNTEPYLRLIVECDTCERLGTWLEVLSAALKDER